MLAGKPVVQATSLGGHTGFAALPASGAPGTFVIGQLGQLGVISTQPSLLPTQANLAKPQDLQKVSPLLPRNAERVDRNVHCRYGSPFS